MKMEYLSPMRQEHTLKIAKLLIALCLLAPLPAHAVNDIHSKTLKSAPISADETFIYDTVANATKKMTLAPFLVGDCVGFPCLDGTSDGGNYIKLYSGSGNYWTALQAGASSGNRSWRLPIAAAPAAGTTRLIDMDEYGQMGFVDPATLGGSFDEAGNYSPTGTWDFSGATVTGIVGNVPTGTVGQSITYDSGGAPIAVDTLALTATSPLALSTTTGAMSLTPWTNQAAFESFVGWSIAGGASEIGDLSDWPSGLTATELGYVNGVTSGIQGQINALSAGSGGTVTVVTSDPYSDAACTGAKYNSANDRFFPCLGGYHTGYVGLTDFSNPTPATYTLTITDPSNGDKITCSDSDLPTPIDCGDGGTDCVIAGIAENAVISGITGVADTGRAWSAFSGDITGATYNAGTVTMSADKSGSATFSASSNIVFSDAFESSLDASWTVTNDQPTYNSIARVGTGDAGFPGTTTGYMALIINTTAGAGDSTASKSVTSYGNISNGSNDYGKIGVRAAFKVNSMDDGNTVEILKINEPTSGYKVGFVSVTRSGSTYTVGVKYYNGSSNATLGTQTISTGNWYEVSLFKDNVTQMLSAKIYDSNSGTPSVINTMSATDTNVGLRFSTVVLGPKSGGYTSGKASSISLDKVQVSDDALIE
jgi:hypothetical protein